jgi:antitoxin Phd
MINISIDEARQNFLKVIQIVDENGAAVILDDNEDEYVLFKRKNFAEIEDADDLLVEQIGEELIMEYLDVFRELAKDD